MHFNFSPLILRSFKREREREREREKKKGGTYQIHLFEVCRLKFNDRVYAVLNIILE